MKNLFTVLFISGFFFSNVNAQFTRYIVKLKNKNGTPYTFFNPQAYLSQRAIDRRTRYNISIDSTDLPVTPSYVTQIGNTPNVTVLNVSKWLNSITIQTTDPNAITTINSFSFVQSTSGIAARIANSNSINEPYSKFETDFTAIDNSTLRIRQIISDYFNYGTSSFNEIHLHNGEFLHNIGLRGQSMQIAMLDNGFNNYTSPNFHAFDSANANNQVLGTWDFVAHEQNVSNDASHGMSCFSTIVANIPGQFVGKAPKANFWLYQTEDNTSEYPIEELNWSCGAERADSSGADIISSSLGYTTFDNASLNHSYSDMNGNITMAAIAADLAAKKGMLVFIANGNSGTSPWHYLTTPADGDSVMAVGAVNSNGAVANFSSYGPSSDGQIKPDVASVGVAAVVQTSAGTVGASGGTSFACPNMAGLGTCLWQGFPEFSNMKIRSALWQSGSIANAPDDRIGYGIPNMKIAFGILLKDFSTANGSIANCATNLSWTSKDVSAMKYEIERKAPGDTGYIKVADIPATANVSILTTHTYSKADPLADIQTGNFSYRIKQIIDTNEASFTAVYIDTVNLSMTVPCITTTLKIIPNPVTTNQVSLNIGTGNAIQKLNIRFFDIIGRMVFQFSSSKTAGTSRFDFPVRRLPKGKYIVSIYDGSQLLASKEFIKL
jgi:serine protease AprX